MANKESKSHNPLTQCPSCRHPYQKSAARVVCRDGRRTIVHLACGRCRQAMLLSVTRRPDGMTCVGMVSDCTFDDARRFLKEEPVSLDDVLAAHEELQLDKLPRLG